MSWLWTASLAAVCYGLYNVFIKLSAGRIHPVTGAVILQVMAACSGAVLFLFLRSAKTPMAFSAKGVWFAVLAGVCVGLAEILSFFVFSRGITVSVGIPVIIGGTVLAGAVLGTVFLGETLRLTDILAVALIVAGIALLGGK